MLRQEEQLMPGFDAGCVLPEKKVSHEAHIMNNEVVAYGGVLERVIAKDNLTRQETYRAFGQIMDGQWSESRIAGLLVALAAKGETAEEIAGAAEAMRRHVVRIDTGGADVVDTCGTGGTGLNTFNISTAAAMVLAGTGVKVAKHGNRTSTRVSGSADVLAALGVNLDASPEVIARCLEQAGVCFCFAIRCHPAMKYAAPVRKQLGVRTIFNVLGPLTNPAGARRQVMGVFDGELTELIAETLLKLGAVRAMVVHGDDGLDEISTTSVTKVSELKDSRINTYVVQPEDFHLPRARMAELATKSPEDSARIITEVLNGAEGPARDVVLLNAAAAIAVADKAPDIRAALPQAAQAIDSGAAAEALKKLVEISNS